MDPSKKTWKAIVMADASLDFDQKELEEKRERLREKLKEIRAKNAEATARNAELKLKLETQNKLSQARDSSISLLNDSKKSLTKEKNDLLKQLELQRIKNAEDRKQQEATLTKYRTMYEQSLSQFHEVPSIKRKLDLETETKKKEIELRVKQKELEDAKSRLKQFVEINERRFHLHFIQLAEAWVKREKEFKRNKELQEKLDKMMEEARLRSEEQSTASCTPVLEQPTTSGISDNSLSLRNLSLSFLSQEGSNGMLKLQELQRKKEEHNRMLTQSSYFNDFEESFRNANESITNMSPRSQSSETSKIPVPCSRAFQKSPRPLNFVIDEGKKLRRSSENQNHNSRIPVSNKKHLNTVRTEQSPSIENALLPCLRNNFVTAPKQVRPPSRNDNSTPLTKRRFDNSSASEQQTRKIPRNEDRSRAIPRKDAPKNIHEVESKPTERFEEASACRSLRLTIEDEEMEEYKGVVEEAGANDISQEILNETYTLEEAASINNAEEEFMITQENPGAVANVGEFHTNACPSDQPTYQEGDNCSVSGYFNDKENSPPQEMALDPQEPDHQSYYGEMPQDDNMSEPCLEFEYDDGGFDPSFLTSPPCHAQDKSNDGVPDPDFQNFLKKCKDASSSPKDQDNSKGSDFLTGSKFSFKRQPKSSGIFDF